MTAPRLGSHGEPSPVRRVASALLAAAVVLVVAGRASRDQMVAEGYVVHVPVGWELEPRSPDYDWDVFFDPVSGDEVQFSRFDGMAGIPPDEVFAFILDDVAASRRADH